LLLLVSAFLALIHRYGNPLRQIGGDRQASQAQVVATRLRLPTHVLTGDVVAPKLGNETLK
jgi:hypothetical protein